ncbi:hypothetical protein F4780DRAFT_527359 [Xylariomycetidae sp. FL0641]|nr:hypothetical protein F4780DRAFT_527359 [Xylariomycetidae sp. FL0641]
MKAILSTAFAIFGLLYSVLGEWEPPRSMQYMVESNYVWGNRTWILVQEYYSSNGSSLGTPHGLDLNYCFLVNQRVEIIPWDGGNFGWGCKNCKLLAEDRFECQCGEFENPTIGYLKGDWSPIGYDSEGYPYCFHHRSEPTWGPLSKEEQWPQAREDIPRPKGLGGGTAKP